jgi:hypothetical protein
VPGGGKKSWQDISFNQKESKLKPEEQVKTNFARKHFE